MKDSKERLQEGINAYRQARMKHAERIAAWARIRTPLATRISALIRSAGASDLLQLIQEKDRLMVEFGDGEPLLGSVMENKAMLVISQQLSGLIGVYHAPFGSFAIGSSHPSDVAERLLEVEADDVQGAIEDILADFVTGALKTAEITRGGAPSSA